MSIKSNLLERQSKCLAQGWPGTNSKRQSQYPDNVPSHLTRAEGCYVWDYDGRRYIDFVGGLGVTVIGYDFPRVTEAVKKQLETGLVSASLPTILELEVAELIQEMVPCAERVRFLKTGNEATLAAVRIARAHQEVDGHVSSEGYHGHGDAWTWLTEPALGVRGNFRTSVFEKGEYPYLHITEPVMLDMSDDRKKDIAWRVDTSSVIIFDEVVTGMRVPKYTVANMWDLQPDIIVLGKSLSNGFPLSVVAGKAEVINCGEYFISSTFSGEAVSLAAAKATLTELKSRNMKDYFFYANRFMDQLNELIAPLDIKIEGYGTRGMFPITERNGALLAQEAANCGILLGKAYFYHFGHMEAEIDEYVLNVLSDAVQRIKRGEVELQGEVPQQTFKR